MGWSSGLYIAEDVWLLVRAHITDKNERKDIANKIIKIFFDHDADDYDSDMKLLCDAEHKWSNHNG